MVMEVKRWSLLVLQLVTPTRGDSWVLDDDVNVLGGSGLSLIHSSYKSTGKVFLVNP
jgi:hypothetical protein